MASPLNVVNALVTNLSAASVLGSAAVGKDYSILERSQGPCAVVFGMSEMISLPLSFGGERERRWTYLVQMFIKDTGSASAVMDVHHTHTPLIVRSLETDQTLQGTVQRVDQIRASRTPGEALQVGAVTVFPIDVEVDVIDWPEE